MSMTTLRRTPRRRSARSVGACVSHHRRGRLAVAADRARHRRYGGFQPVLENTLGTVVAERDIRLPMVELTLSA